MTYPRFHPRSELPPLEVYDEMTFLREFPEENQHVEFKKSVDAKRIGEAAVAFFNADGGVVFVGYAEGTGLLDRTRPDDDVRRLHDALTSVHNPGHFECRRLAVGEKTLVVLSCAARVNGFSQLVDGGVRQRQGASNRKLVGPALSRFVAARPFVAFESTVTPLSYALLTVEQVAAIVSIERMRDDPEIAFERAGLAARVDGELRLTVAGALIALPGNHDVLGRTGIEFRRYTEGGAEPERRETIVGTVREMVERTIDVLGTELGHRSVLVGPRRYDLPRLPPVALRETVANAVAHRAYDQRGSWTRLSLHRDRLVVESPGQLMEPVTVGNLRSQQAARNPLLLRHLRRCGLAEDLGEGIGRIEDDMDGELLPAPAYEETTASFRVTLSLSGQFAPEERGWIHELTELGRIARHDGRLVALARRERRLTNAAVRRELSCDRETATTMLQRLTDAAVLVRSGRRGGTTYALHDDLLAPASGPLSDEEMRRAVLQLAERGLISNADVRQRLGLDRVQVGRLVNRLVADGSLIREGERRGTRYRATTTPAS